MKELVYHRILLPTVERCADKVGFIQGATQRTYAEHIDRVGRVSSGLKGLGVGKGDRFAVLTLNSLEYLELWHSAFLGGGIINPLNLRLAPKELEYILQDSGTKVAFVDGFFAELIDQVRGETALENVVMIGPGDVPFDVHYDELIGSAESVLPDEPEETDPVVLMYTGGTTGLPKGVLLDQRAEMLNLYHVNMLWHFTEDFRYLHQTPLFHAASMGGVLGVPSIGALSVVVPMFEPGAVMTAIEEHEITMTVMVPTMIGLTMMHPEYDAKRLRSLEVLTYGASPMPQAVLEKIMSDLPEVDIFQGYGMTEASAILTVLGPDEHRAGGDRLRSAGRPVPGVALQIQDAEGSPVPRGESGEVCARAGNFMIEYWNKPEDTEEVFHEGWYHTGDAGYLDEDGYLFLVDRVKDMIVTGGENVYSVEVENALASHPAVAQVAVIGIPHDKWGEAVHAIVVVREGNEVTEIELIEHSREWIAGFKVPKSVELRADPLPLSGAMKVLKKDLRAPYWEGHDRAVN